MVQYNFVPGDKSHEIQIGVTFTSDLAASAVTDILSIITETLGNNITRELNTFLQGISYIQIHPQSLSISIVFEAVDFREDVDHEDLAHRRANHIWYLFATIDAKYKIKDHPFPPDFRYWVNIADEYGIDDIGK